MLRTSIILFFIYKFSQVQCDIDCESLRNCRQCIHAPSCGWYLEYRSANGSGCFKNDYIDQHKTDPLNGYSHPPKPTFHILKNENNSVISPQEISLNFRLNDPFTFRATFTPKRETWGKRSVELKHNVKKAGIVKLQFFSRCNNQYGELIETKKCDDVEFGTSVDFEIKIGQEQCSKQQPERIRTVLVNFSPSPAVLKIHSYAYCYCPCEAGDKRGNPEPPPVVPDCHNRGRFKCGVCYCNDGYSGKNCEINTTNTIE